MSEPPPPTDPSPPLPSGAPAPLYGRIGRYRLLEMVGVGGMGAVYRAEDPELGRVVAVKVPRRFDPFRDRVAVQRFQREARVAARVRHPNVCPIHDVGEQDGLPYVVMAFVEGRSLADRLGEGRFEDARAAARLAAQVADALTAVHAQGITHRDLKPGNVLLDRHGQALLADFGLATPGDDGTRLTAESVVLGTPSYMSPEQAAGETDRVGPRSDLYSLGVVLFEMLTGRLPFEGPALSVVARIPREDAPPPSRYRPDLDPALEAVVVRALARRPEDRPASAAELADSLRRWADGSPPAETVRLPRRRRRVARPALALAGMTGLLAVFVTTIFWPRRDGGDASPKNGLPSHRTEITMPDDGTGKTTLPFVIGVLADLAGTPEGKRPPVRERRFVNVGRENFDEVLRRTAPRLVLQLDAWAPPATVTLTFQRLGDFDPAAVAGRVPQLTALLARRQGAADAATPDRELSARLSDILHHPEFQQLEAGWRGLRHLVGRCPEESGVRVCLYRLSKSELFRDVHTAPTPERSYLYRRAYEERLGRLGGEPIGLLVGDYTIGLADVPRLKDVARVAALLHAPFVAAAGPDFFALDQFTQLDGARDLATIFKARRYDDWNEFRREDVSRYVGLALPRVLARRPYDRDSGGATFAFEEAVTGKQHEHYLWMNPAWAYAGCVADAQARHGWPAAAGGGRVEGLPVHVFATDDGDREMKCPTELGLSDRRAGELAALGFLPLVHRRNTDHAVFKDSPSCHEPPGGGAGVASRLDYLLCAARFAHHAQALARDKAGAAQTAADLERRLNDWLTGYVLTDPTADAAERARRPLGGARAVVRPALGRDDGYQLTLEVSPRHAFGEVAQPPLRFTLDVPRRGK